MEQQSLLSEMEFNPVFASTGKRFLNYLIDYIVFNIISKVFNIGFLYGTSMLNSYNYYAQLWLSIAFSITGWFLYYFLTEFLFKGRSIGKFITGTKAVNNDGSDISAKTALLRTLCRIVPFEPFSAFGGHPWHDKWTKTHVIDVKKTEQNNLALQ